MGHSVQWLLISGAVVGMAVGFVSFFRKVLGTVAPTNGRTPSRAVPNRTRETGAPRE
jgi:hypothetical protein